MKHYLDDAEMPTLERALLAMNSHDPKRLAALTGEKAATRKADLAAVIIRHLQGERLRSVWVLPQHRLLRPVRVTR